ncbi:hypothetical protein [Vibrio breoganii]|uniref:hypothetical protein n=1 Tax=Vibrio breoganii TaxID=553239 RepID=UPI000C8647FF|nr:hypothetical protein [Vibrio breoganii]PMK30629.1 hypothetical protein BCU03_09435 [Vibrio breoganii]
MTRTLDDVDLIDRVPKKNGKRFIHVDEYFQRQKERIERSTSLHDVIKQSNRVGRPTDKKRRGEW